MVKFRNYLILLIPVIILAFVYPDHNIFTDTRLVNYISWILTFLWWSYIILFFSRVKRVHEYHSSYNTVFFVWGSLLLGLINTIWGDYTSIFTTPDWIQNGLYGNLWLLILAFPLTLIGILLIFSTFYRYYAIYLGTKVLDARKTGLIITLFNIILILLAIFSPQIIFNLFNISFARNHSYLNGVLLIHLIFESLAFVFGFLKKRPNISHLNSQRVATRINRMDESLGRSNTSQSTRSSPPVVTSSPTYSTASLRPSNPATNSQRSSNQNQNRQQQSRDQQRREQERRNQAQREQQRKEAEKKEELRREQEHRERERREQQRKDAASRQSAANTSKLSSGNLDALRPKTGVLSPDDFKCIFCFRVPKLPEDQHRDIVVCPNCHYPAHIDEFLGWSRNSQFCSRCEGQLPSRYKTNPDKVSTGSYLNAMKLLLKGKK